MLCSASFASGASGSRKHPFGSFRHDGSFPASMISGSVTSRHLCAPPTSDYTSSEMAPDISQDSTHIYINLLDRSDDGVIKSTKFWDDDTTDGDVTIADDTSEFSSIYSEDDIQDIDDDHRGSMDLVGYGISFTPRDMVRAPVQVSLSSHPVLHTKPPIAPHPVKPMLHTSSVHSKVGPWLQHLAATTHTDTSSTTSEHHSHTTLGGTTSSDTCSLHHDNIPTNSDLSSYMQRPMFTCGVTRRKIVTNTRQKFIKKLRKISKLFTRSGKVY